MPVFLSFKVISVLTGHCSKGFQKFVLCSYDVSQRGGNIPYVCSVGSRKTWGHYTSWLPLECKHITGIVTRSCVMQRSQCFGVNQQAAALSVWVSCTLENQRAVPTNAVGLFMVCKWTGGTSWTKATHGRTDSVSRWEVMYLREAALWRSISLKKFKSLCRYPCVFVLEKAEGLGKTERV